jgi:hypothetical protein
MTRFKEMRRIEQAIAQRNKVDLKWALGYCTMRLAIASRKDHIKAWLKRRKRVEAALGL